MEQRVKELEQTEQALKESKERYKKFVSNFQGIAYQGDIEFVPDFFHGQVEEITGYSKKDFENATLTWREIIHPEDLENIILPQIKVITTIPDTELNTEYRIIHKNGKIRWVREFLHNMSENGVPVKISSAIYEITRQKEAVQSLKDSEETYRNIFTHSQVGLFRTDSTTGTIFDINDALAHIAGFKDREELLENSWNIAEHYVDTNRRQEIVEKLIEFGSVDNEEALFVNHLKEYKWLRLSCIMTEKGVIEGVAEDITKIKKAEDALNESEKRNRTYLENSPVCTKIIDETFQLRYMSQAGWRALGCASMDELIGKTYPFDFYPEGFKNEMHSNLVLAKETGKAIIQEAPVVGINGNEIWFHSTITPIFENDKFDYFIVVSADTTERVKAESQINASLKEKEILLQEIHHRVKNNMQIISSLLKLQSNNIKDTQIKEVLKDSQSRVYAMSAVHETLHGSEKLSEIDLRTYLSKITTSVFQTHSVDTGRVKLNSDVENVAISINLASPLGPNYQRTDLQFIKARFS